MAVVTSVSGFGEMSFNFAKYGIRDRSQQERLLTNIKKRAEISTAVLSPDGWLKTTTNVGALTGNDKEAALKQLHNNIEQTLETAAPKEVAL